MVVSPTNSRALPRYGWYYGNLKLALPVTPPRETSLPGGYHQQTTDPLAREDYIINLPWFKLWDGSYRRLQIYRKH